MLTLINKEIKSFLGSLVGYIVIAVFLTTIGLFMWVFPGDTNVLDGGFSTIGSLFYIAPWVFMFLIPAITMRLLSEESRTGTIELLLTKPITDFQIVFAKYLAGFSLVFFSLLPTLVYYYSVYNLGNPVGNIDSGGTWGSYFGLLFLGSVFVAIGLFASSITNNQIISFIVGVFLCFFAYAGFDSLSAMELFGSVDAFLLKLGINEHYRSMSRGVIDTRDVVYFLSVIFLFLLLTKTVLGSRKW
ncbi:MAG: gliding motility-associated ABC transporter permease subunit GldF [Flavobacteriales bacterium CG18_big_fil_WC_8_21_14_2_50_32_9]|nr:gliding motility-associated ABC transporter permease subunit GldF [Flavobacteriales bacterium]NCT16231.1 gliding motility-associated ABC transporter permease subunit GldF [Flavobacteriales bacterium]PIQ15557.1 MAG: gliding motility-associated ABC transporter permease subunit GldF [Flavobacteriales bacterium CG18_big_fil_WC_8_21_14_2_50_32_9]PIZ05426.1 MAG: gliding motility-associated ABC transporter permease subunit GldF [Flavobacteriales bacterium CG_4_10_14_0_8_um_filter_32_5]PJC63062.1 MA